MAPLLNIIHQHAGKSSWILYPNPASEQCTLRYDAGQHDNVHLEVYAPDGRQLKDEWHAVSPSTPLLHLSCVDWPHGIYVVRIGGIHTPSTRLLLAH